MNIVFLDIDGVLIPNNYHDKENLNIDKEKLLFLKRIIVETESKVVLISNWRFFKDEDNGTLFKRLADILSNAGISIYDFTPIIKLKMIMKDDNISFDPFTMRSGEIYKWLNEHSEVNNFVILDDENYSYDFFGYDKNLVLTDNTVGLTKEDLKKAIDLLKSNIKRR